MAQQKRLKPWSISTTVRNPDRIADFLGILKDQFEGAEWNIDAQVGYQTHLIANRLYGAFNFQFYNGLSQEQVALIEGDGDINFEDAKAIMDAKQYTDPGMRGRTSFKPLQKIGFADLYEGKVRVTQAGLALLSGEVDDGDLFLRSLLKWQLPNILDKQGFPAKGGYCLKPFVSVLHLIGAVNDLCRKRSIKPLGISQTELGVFGLTMIRWDEVGETAREIVDFRIKHATLAHWERDQALLEDRASLRSGFEMKYTPDYADNVVRYFRITGLLRLRGQGRFIDHEPVRKVEIDALLKGDTGKPIDYAPPRRYCEVLGDPNQPLLPWETHRELEKKTAVLLLNEIEEYEGEEHLDRGVFANKNIAEMKSLVVDLRLKRDEILSVKAKFDMEEPKNIREKIAALRGLTKQSKGGMQKSLALEWIVASGLVALNDAEEIRPNYPRGDDGLPRAHAPGGKPDIECYYLGFSCVCEVTMTRNRSQWMMESQPVMRHLRDFEDGRKESEAVFALFIAPSIHRDTINTFWIAVKHEFEGRSQRIVPLTIEQFCTVLEVCVECKERGRSLTKDDILGLLWRVVELTEKVGSSTEWNERIPAALGEWKREVSTRQ